MELAEGYSNTIYKCRNVKVIFTWAVLKHPLLGGICHLVLKSASAHLGLDVVEPWKHPWLGVKSQAEPAENLTKWVLGVDILTQVWYWCCAEGYSKNIKKCKKVICKYKKGKVIYKCKIVSMIYKCKKLKVSRVD